MPFPRSLPRAACLAGVLLLAAVAHPHAAVVADKDRFGNVDGRGPLTEKAEQLGLSAADVERLRGATGYIVCPGSVANNGIVASAALVSSNRVIVTVGHAFVDERGLPREPIEDCVFRNQAVPPVEVGLVGGEGLWVGLSGPATPHDPNDYAAAVLSRPVRGVVPLRPMSPATAPGVEDRVIGIVAWQEIAGRTLDPGTPVVQDCAIRDLDAASASRPTNYLTDCDLGPVGSGGHIVSTVNGEWVTHGIFSTSGGELSVGRSFSRRLGSFTRIIALDGGFAAALDRALAAAGR